VAVAGGLVVVAAVLYAAGFLTPSREGAQEQLLKNEWPDRSAVALSESDLLLHDVVWGVQVASGRIPGPEDTESHGLAVQRWLEQASELEGRIQERFPGTDLRVRAVYLDGRRRDSVLLLVGFFTSEDNPLAGELLAYVQEQHPDARLATVAARQLRSEG
jgi:hypothetical protein